MRRRYISAEERDQIERRAEYRCEYCQCWAAYSAQSFVLEHIIPVAKGGKTILDNLCLACGGCNGHKYTKTEAVDPVSKIIVPLFHPRTNHWTEHFCWSDDYLYLIGLTPIGRATVIALQMNRAGVINVRTLLLAVGKHPPTL